MQNSIIFKVDENRIVFQHCDQGPHLKKEITNTNSQKNVQNRILPRLEKKSLQVAAKTKDWRMGWFNLSCKHAHIGDMHLSLSSLAYQ